MILLCMVARCPCMQLQQLTGAVQTASSQSLTYARLQTMPTALSINWWTVWETRRSYHAVWVPPQLKENYARISRWTTRRTLCQPIVGRNPSIMRHVIRSSTTLWSSLTERVKALRILRKCSWRRSMLFQGPKFTIWSKTGSKRVPTTTNRREESSIAEIVSPRLHSSSRMWKRPRHLHQTITSQRGRVES